MLIWSSPAYLMLMASPKLFTLVQKSGWMNGCSVGGVALLHAGHKTGLISTKAPRFIFWCHNHLFLHSSWVYGRNNFCVCMYLVEVVWNYRGYSYSWFLSINWLSVSLTPTMTVDKVLNSSIQGTQHKTHSYSSNYYIRTRIKIIRHVYIFL
jgi:hypothetical protein